MARWLTGTWLLFESDNFEEYMKAIGVGDAMLKVAHSNLSVQAKLQQVLSNTGDDWLIKTRTPSGEREVKFRINEEIETVTLDGRNVTQMTTIDGDKMIEMITGEGFESRSQRYLDSPDVMVTIFEGNGTKSTRKYKRIS